MYWFMILCWIVIAWLGYHVIKFKNPYKTYMVFGKKGSGKTTLKTKLALRYMKKGYHVYSDTYIPGARQFDIMDYGKYAFEPKSVVFIDEAGTIWDARDFAKMPADVRNFARYTRQYQLIVFYFSQNFDIDKRLRDQCDALYICSNFLNCFTISRRVTKKIAVVSAKKSASGESRIVDEYVLSSLLLAPFGGMFLTYIPKYVPYFKSYDPPKKPDMEYEYNNPLEIPPAHVRLKHSIIDFKESCLELGVKHRKKAS